MTAPKGWELKSMFGGFIIQMVTLAVAILVGVMALGFDDKMRALMIGGAIFIGFAVFYGAAICLFYFAFLRSKGASDV
ncbi:hypothetical protein ACFOOP_19370 [Marinicaulis aureus]|uniref:Uncharacterized protein n=1 Tax=Hyphococcus aureus TaxID=2666033 RepID=A0ABW1KZ81_9PROT